MLKAPISPGELIDKLTILDLKAERIADPDKRANVLRERAAIGAVAKRLQHAELEALRAQLLAVNGALWDIETALRNHEARQDFGSDFIALARQVYVRNDTRAAIKRRINDIFGSDIVEEKSYD